MRYLGVLIIMLCLSSCQYFDKKKVSTEDLLNEELKTINWNEVDQYPSFEVCDSTLSKIERKVCFENSLTSHIHVKLSESVVVVSETVQDTVIMEFLISDLGELTIKQIISEENTRVQIPNIDSLLIKSIADLPTIYPAIKRGQQVNTEFKLPIVIEAN